MRGFATVLLVGLSIQRFWKLFALSGYNTLSERAYYEDYIRRFRR